MAPNSDEKPVAAPVVTGTIPEEKEHPTEDPCKIGVTDCLATPTNPVNDLVTEWTVIFKTVSIAVEHSVHEKDTYAPATTIDTINHREVPCETLVVCCEALGCCGHFGHSHMNSLIPHECVGCTTGKKGLAI